MKSGVCPKCGSEEVYLSPTKVSSSYQYIRITDFSSARRSHYVCVACGYVESYINDEKGLRKIAQKWPRADGQKKKRDE